MTKIFYKVGDCLMSESMKNRLQEMEKVLPELSECGRDIGSHNYNPRARVSELSDKHKYTLHLWYELFEYLEK